MNKKYTKVLLGLGVMIIAILVPDSQLAAVKRALEVIVVVHLISEVLNI